MNNARPTPCLRLIGGGVLACVIGTLCACAAPKDLHGNPEHPDGPPLPVGRVSQVVVAAPRGEFIDTDGNGYRDSSLVAVYLMDMTMSRVITVAGDGTLKIFLNSESGQRLASWTFPVTPEPGMIQQAGYGWGYVFELNVNDVATDQFPHKSGGLVAIYIPATGDRNATTTGAASVVIGPTQE